MPIFRSLKFSSSGINDKVQKAVFGKTDYKIAKNNFTSIGISVILSLIAVFILGIISSALCFLLEIVLYNLKRTHSIRRTTVNSLSGPKKINRDFLRKRELGIEKYKGIEI